ncbi:MAG TPA: TetR/AcrR family transcriptional regulator [Acidimicrobiales bacterium]|nr:TetR/AcrR family transcriptional regulator [Acidimicrobiales bacterium]
MPADDVEARTRIVDAARAIVRATGVAPTVAEVADALSITRQTVYRYYPSAEGLLLAAASEGLASFLDDIAARMAISSDPAEVVVEAIAFTVEEIERRSEVALVLAPARGLGSRELTSVAAVEIGRSLLEGTRVDWRAAGYEDGVELEGLVRHMLRMLQSFVVEPGSPPLRDEALRAYLRRWVGPAVALGGGGG